MPTISQFFCPHCCVFMRCIQVGVMVEETMDGGKPYKLWSADMYRCDKCNTRVIGNFGATLFAEHFQKDYRSIKATRDEAGVYIEGIGFARSYSTKGKKVASQQKKGAK